MYLLLANFESAIIAYVSICTNGSTIRITNWLINFDDYLINGYSNFCIETIKTKIEKAYGTRSSQTVPHSSTILARRCLTSVIGRERVYSSWYGCRQCFKQIVLTTCQDNVVKHIYTTLTFPRLPLLCSYKVVRYVIFIVYLFIYSMCVNSICMYLI